MQVDTYFTLYSDRTAASSFIQINRLNSKFTAKLILAQETLAIFPPLR